MNLKLWLPLLGVVGAVSVGLFSNQSVSPALGRLHSLSRDVVAGTALYLLPRKLGLGCRLAEDPMLALQCASGGGGCHPNREARARAEMVEGSDVKFAEAQRLADAMADAVRRRDAAAFIKPH